MIKWEKGAENVGSNGAGAQMWFLTIKTPFSRFNAVTLHQP